MCQFDDRCLEILRLVCPHDLDLLPFGLQSQLPAQAQALIDAGQPQQAIALLQAALQAEADDALLLVLLVLLIAAVVVVRGSLTDPMSSGTQAQPSVSPENR